MSLEIIHDTYNQFPYSMEMHAYILDYSHSKRQGTLYNCRRIELAPIDRIRTLAQDISNRFLLADGGIISKYTDVREYDGTCNASAIYRISETNPDIDIDLDLLFQGIADADTELNPLTMKAGAYLLSGRIRSYNEDHQIKMISMYSPITTLKNRFLFDNGVFHDISHKVLNLRTTMNVVIIDRTVYLLDMSGETLFNLERSYKKKSEIAINEIASMNIISDAEVFRNTASAGHNPRRFVAFSQSKLERLSTKKTREKVAKSFGIALTSDKKFDTSNGENAEKIVKLLCNKAMWDILEEVPVEVDGSKTWSV